MLPVADGTLSPADSLWLELLRRETELRHLSTEEVRAKLAAQGFPDRIVTAYVREHILPKRVAANR